MRRQSDTKTRILEIGDLEVDTVLHEVRRGGAPIDLTTTEYAIVEYMGRRAGQIISRSELIEHVWDENYDGLSNIVDVYIRRLRSKLDEGRDVRLFETVRGAGYRLRDPNAVAALA